MFGSSRRPPSAPLPRPRGLAEALALGAADTAAAVRRGVRDAAAVLLPLRHRAWLLPLRYDVASTCAHGARAVLAIVARELQGAEGAGPACLSADGHLQLMAVLNHEDLLRHKRCSALAVVTVRAALQQAVQQRLPEAVLAVLERYDAELQADYPAPSEALSEELALLLPKHLGQGVEYLRLLKERREGR